MTENPESQLIMILPPDKIPDDLGRDRCRVKLIGVEPDIKVECNDAQTKSDCRTYNKLHTGGCALRDAPQRQWVLESWGARIMEDK